MAMTVPGGGSSEPEVMTEINTTPLIDVMLVLLIMLILTIPIQTDAVKMNMPIGTPPAQLKTPEVVQIDVDFDGTISWNGTVIPDRSALESKLSALAVLQEQPEVHLRPNRLVPYKAVAEVMASAQRLGVEKIGLVGNERFM
ncbi:biopolymer transporter ExbD [Pandoraea horticolens]|uniref:Biopolymer transporter ExbD n=1 Tax=Pandoraea horticolens TaxID=2508298 RepID=A0A5E4VTH2_9BURK|nr:biopolymer transporter ExbD [Pandoraea horticolens]VVE14235.1 biopolymer transporter ExbD [Pandoraea horticolens]